MNDGTKMKKIKILLDNNLKRLQKVAIWKNIPELHYIDSTFSGSKELLDLLPADKRTIINIKSENVPEMAMVLNTILFITKTALIEWFYRVSESDGKIDLEEIKHFLERKDHHPAKYTLDLFEESIDSLQNSSYSITESITRICSDEIANQSFSEMIVMMHKNGALTKNPELVIKHILKDMKTFMTQIAKASGGLQNITVFKKSSVGKIGSVSDIESKIGKRIIKDFKNRLREIKM